MLSGRVKVVCPITQHGMLMYLVIYLDEPRHVLKSLHGIRACVIIRISYHFKNLH